MLAVIETGGKQYLVKPGDKLKVEKLLAEEGKKFTFDQVLLVADEKGGSVEIGKPVVTGASVSALVEKQMREDKIRVVKYKRKVRYRRANGHRQHKTVVKIEKV